jgi:hypothetical protein
MDIRNRCKICLLKLGSPFCVCDINKEISNIKNKCVGCDKDLNLKKVKLGSKNCQHFEYKPMTYNETIQRYLDRGNYCAKCNNKKLQPYDKDFLQKILKK